MLLHRFCRWSISDLDKKDDDCVCVCVCVHVCVHNPSLYLDTNLRAIESKVFFKQSPFGQLSQKSWIRSHIRPAQLAG